MKRFSTDFVCCGVNYCVHGNPGVYRCRRCKTEIYFHTTIEEQQAKEQQRQVAKQTESQIIRIVKRFALESDQGAGDTVERLLSRVGGRVFKRKLEQLGIDCGCTSRQVWLNKRYPYDRGQS